MIETVATVAPSLVEVATFTKFILGLLPAGFAGYIVDVVLFCGTLTIGMTLLLPFIKWIVAKTSTKKDDAILGAILKVIGNPVFKTVWNVLAKFAVDLSKQKAKEVKEETKAKKK